MQILQERLQTLKTAGLTRTLTSPQGIDLSSNDYLGFSNDLELKQRFRRRLEHESLLGSTGSRLLRGNHSLFEETEEQLACFVQRGSALLFPSGYQANVALMSALLREEDVVFSDEFNHASLIDGIRLTKAKKIIFPHLNLQVLQEQLKHHQQSPGLKVIVTESLFSMTGTLANLPELANIAQEFNALLIVDEAHSTGLWGPSLVAMLGLTDSVLATIHTGGKALGAGGAWIAGSDLLKQYLVNFSRPVLFSTAPIPALALLLQETVQFYEAVGRTRAEMVLNRANSLRRLMPQLEQTGKGPILSWIVGDNHKAVQISEDLQARGWDVRAIRPPTVPQGTARLRVTVKWQNTEEQLEQFAYEARHIYNRY